MKDRTRYGIRMIHPETKEEFVGEGFLYKPEGPSQQGTIAIARGPVATTENLYPEEYLLDIGLSFVGGNEELVTEVFKKMICSTACMVANIEYAPLKAFALE